MSEFPACKHKKHKAKGPRKDGLRWLAAEPYRLFFASGALWSIIGVSLSGRCSTRSRSASIRTAFMRVS